MSAVVDSARSDIDVFNVDESLASVVLVASLSLLAVVDVVVSSAVADDADANAVDAAMVSLIVDTNNVVPSVDDLVFLEAPATVVFTSPVSVKCDDVSVIGAAVLEEIV